MASNFHIGKRKFILELGDYKARSFHLCTTMLPNLQALSGFMRNIWKRARKKGYIRLREYFLLLVFVTPKWHAASMSS